jgi:endonuclease/exonuclease/phosphatase family metal-dependent hydrolase
MRIQILSCNIRYEGARDGENDWSHRKGLCAQILRERSPDVICFQEMWARQFEDLSAALPGYGTWALIDRSFGQNPTNGIFFHKDRFERVSKGGFWLSKTPRVDGSKSWASDNVRLANWIVLKDRSTGREFRVINTHLDHISQEARENQARVILAEDAIRDNAYPQILTGDMNSDGSNRAIAILKEGGWVDSHEAFHRAPYSGHTFHEFLGEAYASTIGKMDWIFMRGAVEAKGAEIVRESLNGRFPSDHYFIAAEVEIRPPAS